MLIQLCHSTPNYNASALNEFLCLIQQRSDVGKELIEAFALYYRAVFTVDTSQKSEMIFIANTLVGLHEQRRLQSAIDSALKAPILQAVSSIKNHQNLPIVHQFYQKIVKSSQSFWSPLLQQIEANWLRLTTQFFLSVKLPNENLKLGQDLPPLTNGEMVPKTLQKIQGFYNQQITALVNCDSHTTYNSGAKDWTILSERMKFVVALFRSRQFKRELLQSPFLPFQVEKIKVGRIPKGTL